MMTIAINRYSELYTIRRSVHFSPEPILRQDCASRVCFDEYADLSSIPERHGPLRFIDNMVNSHNFEFVFSTGFAVLSESRAGIT